MKTDAKNFLLKLAWTSIVGYMHKERRQYIRHPSNIPMTYSTISGVQEAHEHSLLHDVSLGGVCFETDECLEPGTLIAVRIPLVSPPFEGQAVVVWRRKVADRYDVGVQFHDKNTRFRIRMVEQVCHIEEYKHRVFLQEGRSLSGEEAAREWIMKYAAQFPAE